MFPFNEAIEVANSYDREFLTNFTHILNIEMSKVHSIVEDDLRLTYSEERLNTDMKLDLPRLRYYVGEKEITDFGNAKQTLLNFSNALKDPRYRWVIQYLEELSSILHQGVVQMIYEAKKQCRNASWHHKFDFRIELLTHHRTDRGMSFCIMPENKVLICIACDISNILMSDHSLVPTNPSLSRFETALVVTFYPEPAYNAYGARLRALMSDTGRVGYSMRLYPLI
ncbi:hypothetical protein [Endozoicomonas lisbonensis]|uniref:Uncharacterized protein n=1 Tax=Endozoicomonas lisbonensis TaxID=3120522 RepID=A0ABV2SI62_9GAMM